MHDQAKYEPLEASPLFADGAASRTPVEGTVARGHLQEDEPFATGIGPDGQLAPALPVPITRELLARGRDRFDVFCSPCHDRVGSGRGMIVRRGFKQPATFHSDRLRASPPGYFFDVITNGFGQMSSYAAQVPPADRWAIVAYLRALQLSQHAPAALLSAGDREELARAAGEPAGGEAETR